jgi:hypothetical protein
MFLSLSAQHQQQSFRWETFDGRRPEKKKAVLIAQNGLL